RACCSDRHDRADVSTARATDARHSSCRRHSVGFALASGPSCSGQLRTLHHWRLWPKQRDQHTMEANELRALQAPLKKRYREQPATALTPARAEAMLDVDRIACRVRSWGGETDAGLPPGPGGDGRVASSAGVMLGA